MSASSRTPAARAISAACRAVECSVSSARSRSSSPNVASCTSTSAPSASTRTVSAGRRVAGQHDPPARARLAEHRVGRERRGRPSRVTDSPRWSAPRSGPGRHAERIGGFDVEPAGAHVLDDRVAHGGDAVVDREDENPVPVALERLAGSDLLHLDADR